jgi:hypothetical protein
MSATDITFFAAVATVIPTFLVAYVVGVQRTMDRLGEEHVESTQRYARQVQSTLEKKDDGVQDMLKGLEAMVKATLTQIASICLFAVAVGMPAAAEYASLHALYAGHAASGEKKIALVGALVAGAVVVAPLVVRALRSYDPFALPIALARGLVEQLLSKDKDPETGSAKPSSEKEEKS